MAAGGRDDFRVLDPDGDFIRRLAEDGRTLSVLIERERLDEIAPLIHRLAGAAGTFGFAEVGELALALDDALGDGRPVAASEVTRLVAAIARGVATAKKSA